MKCSNCGKDVSFVGNVCPYCKADKSKDKVTQVLATGGGIGCALVGSYAFGLWGAVGGFVVGIVGGMVAANKITRTK